MNFFFFYIFFLDYIREEVYIENSLNLNTIVGPEKGRWFGFSFDKGGRFYFELVYLVTALVPSETACLANSPGNRSRTAVWISLDVIVERLL